jgi:hypothetical protein
MHSAKLGLMLGFHGCDESVCKKLLQQKLVFKPSENDYDWLGHGMYFWENNPLRALTFAKEKKRRGEIKKPSVIGAILDLGNCLNLLDSNYLELVKSSYEIFKQGFKGLQFPQNKNIGLNTDKLKRDLDCAVINSLHQYNQQNNIPPFDSVRGLFPEGNPLYDGAGIREKDHIQICITNTECVKGYFLPFKNLGY